MRTIDHFIGGRSVTRRRPHTHPSTTPQSARFRLRCALGGAGLLARAVDDARAAQRRHGQRSIRSAAPRHVPAQGIDRTRHG